ncbi:hypothetical protein CAL28_27220 [Bordetella genomosp. 11]|uniref:Uncharacterized protein n=1 Tax=Bordetella genomosp. 11 TaxID=1416808 RepID=A0A261ULR2_9BORD|nr:hypothetical protein CAL28_27220 [Bordetella genomosp. 11]
MACWAAMAGLGEMGGQARWRCSTNARGGRVSVARCDADKEVDAGESAAQPERPWLLAVADASAMQG